MKKKKNAAWLPNLLLLAVGAACGVVLGRYAVKLEAAGLAAGQVWLRFGLLTLGLVAAVLLQIILHEAGHGLAGRLSGYKLLSFRVGSLMWVRQEGRWRLRRFSLAGTGGQCLMAPPDLGPQGELACGFYLLGGALLNLLLAVIFWVLHTLCGQGGLSLFFLELSAVGLALALSNGLPLRLATIDNDGYTALALRKDKAARRAFWLQMKINEQISQGQRLKEMPAEWFNGPLALDNPLSATVAVFVCNRLLDEGDISGAATAIDKLLAADNALPGLYRYLLTIDRLYCELLGAKDPTLLAQAEDKALRKFCRSMANYPSVLRLSYAQALAAQDGERAAQVLAAFERMAARYPYPCEIVGERELMAKCNEIRADGACEIRPVGV